MRLNNLTLIFLLTFAIGAPALASPITLKSVLKSVSPSRNSVVTPKAAVNKLTSTANQSVITGVRVVGNAAVSTGFILDNALLRSGEALTPQRIARSVRNLQALGLFSDVKTRVDQSGAGVILTFLVKEFPVINAIQFRGVSAFETVKLQSVIGSRAGDLLDIGQVRKDTKAIEKFYLENGYERTRVMSFELPASPNNILVFNVSEAVLEAVDITGNLKTKEYVITREMQTKIGDPIQSNRLISDIRRIYNLGYFTSVVPELVDGASDHGQVLRLNIEERNSNATFTAGGGFSPTAGFSFFSDVYWDNLFGTGQLLSFKSQFGRASTYQFRFYNPWAFGERRSFTYRMWAKNGQVDQFLPNSSSVGYRNERSHGVELGIGWPFSYEFVSNHSVKYESVELLDSDKKYTINSYTLGLSYDTRDVRFNPLDGSFHTLTIEKAFWFNPMSLDYTRYDLELRQFFKLADQQTIATRLALGFITGPQVADNDLFAREYYRVGGSSTVRGWNDFYPFAIGTKRVLASVEYRFVFNDFLQAVAFVDSGVASMGDLLINDARIGKGIGVRFNVPALGPIRLDWAFNDLNDSYVHVSVGHSF